MKEQTDAFPVGLKQGMKNAKLFFTGTQEAAEKVLSVDI